jgi:hypothetical protein
MESCRSENISFANTKFLDLSRAITFFQTPMPSTPKPESCSHEYHGEAFSVVPGWIKLIATLSISVVVGTFAKNSPKCVRAIVVFLFFFGLCALEKYSNISHIFFLNMCINSVSGKQHLLTNQASLKIFFHAFKYPQFPVNGVLLGSAAGGKVKAVDAVPLFHDHLNMLPLFEMAMLQVCLHFFFFRNKARA